MFLPGGSRGRGSLLGCHLWDRAESDTTDATWQRQQHQAVCEKEKLKRKEEKEKSHKSVEDGLT